MRPLTSLAALAAVVIFAAPAPARVWKRDWLVGAHPAVQISTNDARVAIHRGVPGQVSATIEYTVQVWGLHTQVQEPLLEFTQHGDAIVVSARSRGNAFFFGGMNERFHVDVSVPPNCDVMARSGDGAVTLEPVTGAIDVQTGDGHVVAHGARGHVRLWTGDGGIDADELDGDLEAHTGDGRLRVSGRFDRLDLSSGDGGVEATVAPGSRLAAEWSVHTSDGSVTLRIPRGLAALLDASAHDGRVHVELPIADRGGSEHELRGQLNGGTRPLRVRTGDGSVTLALSD